MTPRLRKTLLTSHVVTSVAWLGSAAAYLALAISGISNLSAMLIVGWYVTVPLAFLALATGIIQSLTTQWGLARHYWVLAKLVLTVLSLAILVGHMRDAANRLAEQHVVHSAGGVAVLVIITVLSVFKPRGRTPFGRRDVQGDRN